MRRLMKRLTRRPSALLLAGALTVQPVAAAPKQELLNAENMARWQQTLSSESRGALVFDAAQRQIHANTYDTGGHWQFIDTGNEYSDFRIDCVVRFHKVSGKYGGFNILLRETDGKRYWVYLRPNNRGLYAVKVRADSGTIPEYETGKKQADRPDEIELGRDYTFSVEMRGRSLVGYLDGTRLLEFVDPMPEVYARGRIGFSGGAADLTIKSVRVTDLTMGEGLAVQSYAYVNPPERGDSSGAVLTDGKINGKDEQALWWLATKGDPVIVFDLGGEYFVNGIKLKALASPSANISAYRVLGSEDGQQWKLLGADVNEASDSREQEQVLYGAFAGIARHVKVMLLRQAGDATIKLDEVDILGREVRPDDRVAVAVAREYYTGPALAPVSADGDEDDHWFYLEGGGLRAAVSRMTGNLGPVHTRGAGRRCTMVSHDRYRVETRAGAEEFSEADNEVVKHARADGVLTLTCRNDGIADVDIIQRYRATEHGVGKTTEFVNRGSAPDLFVTVGTGAVLDEEFRAEGWYFGADRGLGARLRASEVTMPMTPTCHSPKNTKVVALMNYDAGLGLSQYRYAINGQYCNWVTSRYFEKGNHPPLYTANGWSLGLVTLHLEPGKPRSVDVRWHLFEEDEFFFIKQFMALPEVAPLYNIDRPDWLLRLKTYVIRGNYPLGTAAELELLRRRLRQSYDLYDDGCLYSLMTADDVWGDWYQGDRFATGWCGEKIDNDAVRDLFAALHRDMPNLKMGLYTWAWTGWPHSRSHKEHPEWFIPRNKEGYITKGYQNGPMNYIRRISAPGCMENLLAGAHKMLKHFDTDYFYLDGGGGGNNVIDWERLAIDYDTDWQTFHWGLNKACRKVGGRERVFFTNSRCQGYVDIGFYEGINNRLNELAWRDSGDALLALKMRSSLFPKMTFIPIYWRGNTFPFYSNYCIGLGFVPENIYQHDEVRNVPYVTAAYETRMFKFAPAHLAPDWRKDADAELEAYSMTHAPAAVLSIVNHSKMPVAQEVSADARRLGLDPERPLFSWLVRMNDIREKEGGVSERVAGAVYQRTGWGIDLVARPEFRGVVQAEDGRIGLTGHFDRNLLNMALFSHCPAIVYSVNGRRQQIWQPHARGVVADGSIDMAQRVIALKVAPNNTADATAAELLVYVPNEWQDLEVSGAALKQQVFLGKQRFLLLGIEGFGEVSVTAARTEPFAITGTQPLTLKNVAAPCVMGLALPEGDRHVTVYSKGIPVFFGNSDMLELPPELAAGDYQIHAVAGGVLHAGRFNVDSTWSYKRPAIERARRDPDLQVTPVDRTVNGIHVLRSAVQSHDGYSQSHFTEVDPDRLAFAAGSPDIATSKRGHAMAGLELDGLSIVQLRVRNTFFERFSNYVRHTWRPGSAHAFAGLIVDYHTPEGYAKRVALSMGLLQRESDAVQPDYGKRGAADLFVRLQDYIDQSAEATFAINLGRWAPENWDRRAWISAACNGGVYPGRKLFVEILGNGDTAGGAPLDEGELVTRDLEQPTLVVPAATGAIAVDGKLDDEAWTGAARTEHFKRAISMRDPDQKTEMSMCRDDENLYIALKCGETERKHLMSDGEKLWSHDALDITFAPLPRRKYFHKFVIDWENAVYQETRPLERERENWEIVSAVSQGSDAWFFEVAVPLRYLELKDGEMAFNMLRYRPEPSGTAAFSWSLIPLEDYMDPKWFGTIGF